MPPRILLYAILDSTTDERSLSLNTVMELVGRTFALDNEGMTELLIEIDKAYSKKGIPYTRTAGVYELQFKQRPDTWGILAEHYAN
ncbi:MAG: DUF4007 family protein [Flavobacteriales bacterium]|nr:DUF4007 family protein [Flavobacteriales bacterium]